MPTTAGLRIRRYGRDDTLLVRDLLRLATGREGGFDLRLPIRTGIVEAGGVPVGLMSVARSVDTLLILAFHFRPEHRETVAATLRERLRAGAEAEGLGLALRLRNRDPFAEEFLKPILPPEEEKKEDGDEEDEAEPTRTAGGGDPRAAPTPGLAGSIFALLALATFVGGVSTWFFGRPLISAARLGLGLLALVVVPPSVLIALLEPFRARALGPVRIRFPRSEVLKSVGGASLLFAVLLNLPRELPGLVPAEDAFAAFAVAAWVLVLAVRVGRRPGLRDRGISLPAAPVSVRFDRVRCWSRADGKFELQIDRWTPGLMFPDVELRLPERAADALEAALRAEVRRGGRGGA